MTNTVTNILSRDEELALRKPIEDYVGKIQAEIDELREEGTNKVLEYSEEIESLKRDKIYTKAEKEARLSELTTKLQKAKEIEAKNKQPISEKIAQAEKYLKDHYQTDYYNKVVESNKYEVQKAKSDYDKKLKDLEKEHKDILSGLSDKEEIKEENFIYKNRLFDAKLEYTKNMQEAKDRKHDAFTFEYHLIDLLKMSNFSFAEKQAQKIENYKYSFNTRDFLLKNGLYIAIIFVFIFLCIITPIKKNGLQLLTVNNILSIMQQASPRMFLALGVAGLIMLAGTDLSVGRMVGMGMTAATIIMHNGPNTGSVFGPLCIIIVAAVIPIPTIRPTDKSVPANMINPATPNAKNILGDACCIILKMLLTVRSCNPFFLIGVIIHKKMNTKIIAIYKPFFNKKSRVLNEYL